MAVMNRSMFQRPMPVVRRQDGTPMGGERQEGITIANNEGINAPSLFERIKNSKVVQGINDFLDKPTDQYGEGSAYELNEYEFNLLYPNVAYPSSVMERIINTESDDYRKLVELTVPSARAEGSPPQGEIVEEQVNTENVGIMDGFSGEGGEAEAMAMLEEGERAKNEIDDTNTYDELMRSIRGDDLSEADRRQELASYVGEKDAEETPDSVLTLVQPVMQMLDQDSANTGIGQIEEGQEMSSIAPTQQDAEEMMAMNMPPQPVGVANGGYMSSFPNQNLNTESLSASDNIDDRIMQNLQFERMAPGMMGYANGGPVQPIQHFNKGNLATSYKEDYLPLYMELMQGYNDPERNKANTLMDISKLALAYGRGDIDPSQVGSMFLDSTQKRVNTQDAKEKALEMQLKSGALSSAIAADTAAKAAAAKATNTLVKTGNAEKDLLTATLLGMTIDEFNAAYPITGTTFQFSANGSLNKFNEPKDKKESSVYIGTIGQEDTAVFADLNLNLDGIAENTLVYKKPNGEYEFSTPKAKDKIEYVVSYPTVVDGEVTTQTAVIDISSEEGINNYNKFLEKFADADNAFKKYWKFDKVGGLNLETNITNVQPQPQAKGGLIKKRNTGTPIGGENSNEIEIAQNIDFENIPTKNDGLVDVESQTVNIKEGSSNENILIQKANQGEEAIKLLDQLYEVALNYPQYFGIIGGAASYGKSGYLSLDQIFNSLLGVNLPEIKFLDSPVIDQIAGLQDSIASKLASVEKQGSFRSITNKEKNDKKDILNIYAGNAKRTMDSIRQIRKTLVNDINSFYRQTGNSEKKFETPQFYNIKPKDIKSEDMKLEIIKSSLPKEMLDLIDTDPQIMNAITAIMNGKDPELVIKKYKEWKSSQ
tara:strand:+ start:977 stop:3616 length:2640 start_codon:yes stop_codon:yes gene_type:complete